MKKVEIRTDKAPRAIGPYSQAVSAGQQIFVSMQIGIDPARQELVEGGLEPQIRQIFLNMGEILGQAGTDLTHVVKTTLFIKNLSDFKTVNQVYSLFFQSPYPARSLIVVTDLPMSADVGMDAVALL